MWGEKGREHADGTGSEDGILVEGGAGAVNGFRSFVLCDGSASEGLAVMCFEKDLDMFVDACVDEVDTSEAANVIDDVFEEKDFESA